MAIQPSQAPINALDCRWILPLLVRALDNTMSRKEAAILMNKDQAQLSRQIQSGHLTCADLGALGEEYWRNVHDELRAHFDLLDKAELAAQGDRHMDRAKWFYAKAAQR